jgi:tetratricopeptide (TPR) repeat protein
VSGIALLEQRIADDPGDAKAHYQLAVLLLATWDLRAFDSGDVDGVLARAERLLSRAIDLDPKHAPAHATLGFTFHQRGTLELALASFLMVRRLNPKDEIVDVYVPTILVEMQRDAEALVELSDVARRQKVDLPALRAKLAKVAFPTDARTLLKNGFIHARNFFWSRLTKEAERIQNSLDRDRKARVAKGARDECRGHQRDLKQGFDTSRVPASIRALAPAASRYGVGDDVCRPLLMKKIPRKDRAKLIEQVDKLAARIDDWLRAFPEAQMSHEAAAFMYLMEGVEEMRSR